MDRTLATTIATQISNWKDAVVSTVWLVRAVRSNAARGSKFPSTFNLLRMKSVTDCPNPLTPIIPHFLMLLLLYLLARGVRVGRFRTCEEVAFIRLHVFAMVQSAFYFSFDAFFLWRRIMRPGVVILGNGSLWKARSFKNSLDFANVFDDKKVNWLWFFGQKSKLSPLIPQTIAIQIRDEKNVHKD